MFTKTYRLLALKTTTPLELYRTKIDKEEYGEALELARHYSLDTDEVYQRQWMKSNASTNAILDYLSKIKKRSWVLPQCLDRVPSDIVAAKKLLLYGLKGTNLDTLTHIAKGKKNLYSKFVSRKIQNMK